MEKWRENIWHFLVESENGWYSLISSVSLPKRASLLSGGHWGCHQEAEVWVTLTLGLDASGTLLYGTWQLPVWKSPEMQVLNWKLWHLWFGVGFFLCLFWGFVVSDLGALIRRVQALGLIGASWEALGSPADGLWRQIRGEDRKTPENQTTETGHHWPHLVQDTFMQIPVGARPTQTWSGTQESDWGWTVEDSQLIKFSQGIPRPFQKAFKITLVHGTGPTNGLLILLISSPPGFPNNLCRHLTPHLHSSSMLLSNQYSWGTVLITHHYCPIVWLTYLHNKTQKLQSFPHPTWPFSALLSTLPSTLPATAFHCPCVWQPQVLAASLPCLSSVQGIFPSKYPFPTSLYPYLSISTFKPFLCPVHLCAHSQAKEPLLPLKIVRVNQI